jgi:hypothetical protein
LRVAERGRVQHDPVAQTVNEVASPLTAAAVQRLRGRFGEALRVWPER